MPAKRELNMRGICDTYCSFTTIGGAILEQANPFLRTVRFRQYETGGGGRVGMAAGGGQSPTDALERELFGWCRGGTRPAAAGRARLGGLGARAEAS